MEVRISKSVICGAIKYRSCGDIVAHILDVDGNQIVNLIAKYSATMQNVTAPPFGGQWSLNAAGWHVQVLWGDVYVDGHKGAASLYIEYR